MDNQVYGIHAVMAFLISHPQSVKYCYLLKQPDTSRLTRIIDLCEEQDISYRWLPKRQFDARMGDVVHQGVFLDVIPLPIFSETDLLDLVDRVESPFLLLLDTVQDPHNLGACLRTACAAGVHAVLVPKDKSVGLTPAVRKVACGAAERIPFCQVTNFVRMIQQLQKKGIWFTGLTGDASQSLYDASLSGPIGIIMGTEHEGLRRLTREHCDFLASIPMLGQMESLNVSVATGVALYEVLRQRGSLISG